MASEFGPITWDGLGERLYETGVDHVVLYPYKDGKYEGGVAWNGVTGITENKSGAEQTALYADNLKYLNMTSLEEYGVTIECYTYPELFEQYNGTAVLVKGVTAGQQARGTFGLSFRTLIGNDEKGDSYGYKLHLVYGCTASPSEESNATINESPEAKTLSYEVSTVPVAITGKGNLRSTSCITIDSTKCDADKLAEFLQTLYGDGSAKKPTLPLPAEVITALTPSEAV